MILLWLLLQEPDTLEAFRADQANDDAWAKAKPLTIAIKKALEPDPAGLKVTLKALVSGDRIYLRVEWPDSTCDTVHKPWVWNKNAYEVGKPVEDSCAVAFPMKGEFNPNMLACVNATWDVWHWKAARTDPAGFAMDKTHVYATEEFKGGKPFTVPGGKIWMARREDEGKSVTRQNAAPAAYQGDLVPQYSAEKPDGSAADVQAKGRWKDGVWSVEFSRALKTGHADDCVLEPGGRILFSVACFDHVEEDDHSVSEALQLILPR
jgi:hypothetical protein